MITTRMNTEKRKLIDNPPYCVKFNGNEESIWEVEVQGPKDSPYEGGIFKLKIEFTNSYPFNPPNITFVTPIYHPNISSDGKICLKMLEMAKDGGDWIPGIMIRHVLIIVVVLMSFPSLYEPIQLEIANEFEQDKETFISKAKNFTKLHACKPDTNTN